LTLGLGAGPRRTDLVVPDLEHDTAGDGKTLPKILAD